MQHFLPTHSVIPSAATVIKMQMAARVEELIGFDEEVSVEELTEAEGIPKPLVKEPANRDSDEEDVRTVVLDATREEEEARGGTVLDIDTAEEVAVEVIAELVIGAEDDEDDGGPTMIPVIEGMGGGPVAVRCRK